MEINHLCGGLFIARKQGVQYFASSVPDSVRNWQNSWFYCKVNDDPNVRTLPPYSHVRLTSSQGWNPRLTNTEKEGVIPIMREVVRMKKNGLDAMDLIATYVSRRIQPLQARPRGMWTYTGSSDTLRYSNVEMQTEEFETRMKVITSVSVAVQMVGRVRPLDHLRPPPLNASLYRSSIPLLPPNARDEDEESNTIAGGPAGLEEDEVDSEVPPSPTVQEWCSKSNQDRDSAKEGVTWSRKRSLPPSNEEAGSSKIPAVSPSPGGSGKVAPLRPKKTLTTLGGRKAGTSVSDTSPPRSRVASSGQQKTGVVVVAPLRRKLKIAKNVRPSGSESLPDSMDKGTETCEDTGTCGVADFLIMDTIPEQAPVEEDTCVFPFVNPKPTVEPEAPSAREEAPELVVTQSSAQDTVLNSAQASSTEVPITAHSEDAMVSSLKESLIVASQFEVHLRQLSSQAEAVKNNMHEACKLGSVLSKLRDDHAALRNSHQALQEEHQKLKEIHAKDADAAKEAFDAKVKEHDDFVRSMKKEIDQVKRRAKEKQTLVKQLQELQEAKKKDENSIAKLQSDLQKISELRQKEKERYDLELVQSKADLKAGEGFCAARFDMFSEKLSVFATDPEIEKAKVDDYGEIFKREAYSPSSVDFAKSLGRLHIRTQQAERFANEVVEATLSLKNFLWQTEEHRVNVDSAVQCLQAVPNQVARWKRSSARSGANYALALTKAHLPDKVHNLEKVGEGEPEQGASCTTYLARYAETASQIARLPDLNFFVESAGVESESDEAGEE